MNLEHAAGCTKPERVESYEHESGGCRGLVTRCIQCGAHTARRLSGPRPMTSQERMNPELNPNNAYAIGFEDDDGNRVQNLREDMPVVVHRADSLLEDQAKAAREEAKAQRKRQREAAAAQQDLTDTTGGAA